MENKMFCYQCQETAGCSGCTKFGVCGKSPDLARMQDLLIYTTKGLSEVTTRLRAEGVKISKDVNHLITINLFTTITNANFDDAIFYARIKETLATKEALLAELNNKENLSEAALWNATTEAEMDQKVSFLERIKNSFSKTPRWESWVFVKGCGRSRRPAVCRTPVSAPAGSHADARSARSAYPLPACQGILCSAGRSPARV